jgi:hypothetical protein
MNRYESSSFGFLFFRNESTNQIFISMDLQTPNPCESKDSQYKSMGTQFPETIPATLDESNLNRGISALFPKQLALFD